MFVKCMLAILCGLVMAQSVKLIEQDADLYELDLRLAELEAENEPVPYVAPIRHVNIMEFRMSEDKEGEQ